MISREVYSDEHLTQQVKHPHVAKEAWVEPKVKSDEESLPEVNEEKTVQEVEAHMDSEKIELNPLEHLSGKTIARTSLFEGTIPHLHLETT